MNLSIRWMVRAHSLIPLTEQESQVKDLLLEYGLGHLTHAVFPNAGRFIVVDFFVSDNRTVIECWRTAGKRGIAIGWMERNAAFIDVKFRRLKALNPGLRCVALAEAPNEEPHTLSRELRQILEHADIVAFSIEDLRQEVANLGGVA